MLRQEDYEVNAQQIPEASGRETVPAQDESFGDFVVKYVRRSEERRVGKEWGSRGSRGE